jgi:hypothetical protein
MRQYLLDSAPLAAYLNGRQVAVDLISPWIARHAMATAAHRDHQIVLAGELDALNDVRRAGAARDQRRAFVNHGVEDLPGEFIAVVRRAQHSPRTRFWHSWIAVSVTMVTSFGLFNPRRALIE